MRAYRLLSICGVLCGLGILADSATAIAAGVAQLNENDPMTWLVKSVCVDSQKRLLEVDPYGGCPAGATIRKISFGDPLPYHNVEQLGYQQRDAFPVSDPLNSQTWIINTYDYAPFNFFNVYALQDAWSDGYDVIAFANNVSTGNRWASIVNTSDGGGYGQIFYGSGCSIADGWLLFPAAKFLSGGNTTAPIKDVYWEQSDQNYPGNCPSTYSRPITTWKLQKRFKFGGVAGNPIKTTDTMISYHGFQSRNSTLEVFYFTREYGMTRWEVWTPLQSTPKPTPTTECVVPSTQRYNGVTYVVTVCHDWSKINTPLPFSEEPPIWPIPNLNVLQTAQNPHFISTINPWTVLSPLSAMLSVSTEWRDKYFTGIGVGYLGLSCGVACTVNGNFNIALYQDLPASRFVGGGSYGFGISVRTDTNQCPAPCSGSIGVGIEQLDAGGNVISQDTKTTIATVTSDNGTPDLSTGEGDSVYLSTAFVSGSMTVDPNAAWVRFLIAPQSAQTFDVLDAWLAPWPAFPTATPEITARAQSPGRFEFTRSDVVDLVAHPSELGAVEGQ